jgi:hypothetical protein
MRDKRENQQSEQLTKGVKTLLGDPKKGYNQVGYANDYRNGCPDTV